MNEFLEVITGKYNEKDYELPLDIELNAHYPWDDFQLHAFHAIQKGNNILVSAPTSSGKTAIAKYGTLTSLRYFSQLT